MLRAGLPMQCAVEGVHLSIGHEPGKRLHALARREAVVEGTRANLMRHHASCSNFTYSQVFTAWTCRAYSGSSCMQTSTGSRSSATVALVSLGGVGHAIVGVGELG